MSQASIQVRPPTSLATDQLNNRIFFRIFQVANVLQRQAVKQLGVTTVQWAVLGALSQGKFASGVHVGDLAEYLVVSRQNLDGVLKRLERDKLVERVPGVDDRRARVVRLTPRGRAFWDNLLLRIYQFYDQAAARFKFDERVALAHYLNQLQKDLDTVSLPEPGLDERPAR
jgi:DNA-binding MarR family transcriptional regulator